MNDIYKQKAKKYKYKYIKLKKKIKEIEGGQKSIQKYVVQGLKKNEWIDIPDKQIKLINSSNSSNLSDLNKLNWNRNF